VQPIGSKCVHNSPLQQRSTQAEISELHPDQHTEHFKFIFNVLSTPDHLALSESNHAHLQTAITRVLQNTFLLPHEYKEKFN